MVSGRISPAAASSALTATVTSAIENVVEKISPEEETSSVPRSIRISVVVCG